MGDAVAEEVFDNIYRKLLPFQKQGVDWAVEHNGRCLIADEMGLGKTVQAIALVARFSSDSPALIVCPASMRSSWIDELERWMPSIAASRFRVVRGRSDVDSVGATEAVAIVCSYGLLTSGSPVALAIGTRRFRMCVVDESHNLRTRTSQRTRVLDPVLRGAQRLVLLSGTPALSRPCELWPQLAPLAPEAVGSWTHFTKTYCGARRGRFGWDVSGATNLEELHSKVLGPLMVRSAGRPPTRRRRPNEAVAAAAPLRLGGHRFAGSRWTCSTNSRASGASAWLWRRNRRRPRPRSSRRPLPTVARPAPA